MSNSTDSVDTAPGRVEIYPLGLGARGYWVWSLSSVFVAANPSFAVDF